MIGMGAEQTTPGLPPGTKVPSHIAVIMDGNGRWAKERGYGRSRGHREGAKKADLIITECARLGVKYLTMYAFSTENWNRPRAEVTMLMRFLVEQLRIWDKKLVKNQIMLVAQGEIERLPAFAQAELKRVVRVTALENPRMIVNLSLSYGARQELVDAFKKIARRVQAGEIAPESIDEETIRLHLYQPTIPDPDILIRTGGEYRVSNFLLWQIAYTELYISPRLWPDFESEDLHEAIIDFGNRQRRFGKTSDQVKSQSSDALQSFV